MRLSTKDFLFYQMLYKLWLLLVYYADIFCYSAPKNMLEMDMETGGITVATEVYGMGFVMVSKGNVTTITYAPVNG